MSRISSTAAVYADSDTPLIGLSDMALMRSDDRTYLIAGSEFDGSLTVFDVTDGAGLTVTDVERWSEDSGTQGLTQLLYLPHRKGDRIVTVGRYDDNLGVLDIDADGQLVWTDSFVNPDGYYANTVAAGALFYGDRTILFTTQLFATGFDVTRVNINYKPIFVRHWDDGSFERLSDVSVLHATVLQGVEFMFAASQQDAGIQAYRVQVGGGLNSLGRTLAYQSGGWDNPTDLESIQFDSRAFLVLAGAGSNTLHVLRVSVGGKLKAIDREDDTLATRFEGVQDMAVFDYDGRWFVLAGGADDGVSLFEITYRGKFVLLDTVADQFTDALDNVSSIQVQVIEDTAHAYVASGSEHGITHLTIDLSRSGEDLRGDAVRDDISGTENDDVIWGMGKSDTLRGGTGADRLIDGRGRDTLIGGPGADVFEFLPDGRTDWIEDFEPGVDKIDLTSFPFVYHISSVFVAARKNGAVIKVGEDIIRLTNPDGGPYDIGTFDLEDMFIFG